MKTFQHKVISVTIATVAAYFGFQALEYALAIYQVGTYFMLSWYVYAFHIFWLTFIFDLHLKGSGHWAHARVHSKGVGIFLSALLSRVRHLYHWTYLRHYFNYLILPSVIYWSVIVLMYLNPFNELFKDGLIVIATGALSVAYWYFKTAFNHHMEVHQAGLKILGLVKIFAAYLTYTAIVAAGWYYGLPLSVLMPAVFIMTFLLVYQALFQHRLLKLETYPLILLTALMVMLVFAVVFLKWNMNYYTAGLMIVVVYNTCWGLLHKYLDRTLTRAMVWEYAFMLIILVSLVLASHDFKGRIFD